MIRSCSLGDLSKLQDDTANDKKDLKIFDQSRAGDLSHDKNFAVDESLRHGGRTDLNILNSWMGKQDADINQMRSWIQNSLLSYSSPGTSPRQYKIPTSPPADRNTNRDIGAAEISPKSSDALPRLNLEAAKPSQDFKGYFELRECFGSKSGMLVMLTIDGRGLLSIFGGRDFKKEMGKFLLRETVISAFFEHTDCFALGTKEIEESRIHIIDEEVIYIFAENEEVRNQWISILHSYGAHANSNAMFLARSQQQRKCPDSPRESDKASKARSAPSGIPMMCRDVQGHSWQEASVGLLSHKQV